MTTQKELESGVVATWKDVVRTEMDYKAKTAKATVYYYLDEQAFLDGKEPVMGEAVDVPFVEQEELKKEGQTMLEVARAEISKVVKEELTN